jgi:hypothetical protein
MPAVSQGRCSGHVIFTDNLFIDFECSLQARCYSVRGVPCPEVRRLDRLSYQWTLGKRDRFCEQIFPDSQLRPAGLPKRNETTTPNRIRKWSPTLLLTGRYPGCLRRSDGMRNFLDSMVVDEDRCVNCSYQTMRKLRDPFASGESMVLP